MIFASALFLLTFLQQAPAPQDPAPLPDIPTLMRDVEANQKKSEDLQKNYIYQSAQSFETLKGNGAVKKEESRVVETFWIDGVQVSRELERDGKPLTPDEARKENERIDKEVAKARTSREKDAANGKEPQDRGEFILPISRYLQLGAFSNARRVELNGRPTIVADFAGDPHAKTNNDYEKAIRVVAGTVWVDEQDQVIQHLDAHFTDSFKVGGGLLVSIGKGFHFTYTNRKINDEVWLRDSVDGNGHVRAFLFFSIDGDFHLRNSDYRRFKATSTVLPTFTPVPEEPKQ